MCCIPLPSSLPNKHRAPGIYSASWCLRLSWLFSCYQEKDQLSKGLVFIFFADKLLEHLCKRDKQHRMCLLFGFEKEVMYMPKPCSYIGVIVSCKINSVEHGQRWAGEVLGESWEGGCQEVLLTSQAACFPYLCPNFERNREGFGLPKAAALVSSLHCERRGGWRSPVHPVHRGCSKHCVTPLPASITLGCLAD